jgi:hypothetical protein
MKIRTIISVLLLSVSCIRLASDSDIMTEVVFSVREDTKATSGISETAINHWAVMLFDTDNPAAWYYAVSDSGADITCTARKDRSYRAYAIVNYPEDGQGAFDPAVIESEDHLKGFSSFLGGNSLSSLAMFGSIGLEELPAGRTAIQISRLCSRVSIQKISLDVTDPVYAGKEFTVKALYLTNVYCTGSLFSDHSAPLNDDGLWYNAMGWHGSGSIETTDALVGDRGLSVTISNGASYTTTHCFYAYPNATGTGSDSHSETWRPRCTRLVIEATMGSKRYYYPITIPEMQRNHSYNITEAVIHGPGSLDPEQEIPGVLDVTLSITTNTWDSEYYISENS